MIGTGVLAGLDGYMNIAMEQTEEYENGKLCNKYADTFIRGSNGKRVPLLPFPSDCPQCCTSASKGRKPSSINWDKDFDPEQSPS